MEIQGGQTRGSCSFSSFVVVVKMVGGARVYRVANPNEDVKLA
jgi:hypothetical protein